MLGKTRGQEVLERRYLDMNATSFKPGDAILRHVHGSVPARIVPQGLGGPAAGIVG